MTKLPQLTHLILNYYRENLEERSALQPLLRCKLSRWWRTFIINCPDLETYAALLQVQVTLLEPLSKLRLAKKVQIRVKHQDEIETIPVASPKEMAWEQALRKVKLHR